MGDETHEIYGTEHPRFPRSGVWKKTPILILRNNEVGNLCNSESRRKVSARIPVAPEGWAGVGKG